MAQHVSSWSFTNRAILLCCAIIIQVGRLGYCFSHARLGRGFVVKSSFTLTATNRDPRSAQHYPARRTVLWLAREGDDEDDDDDENLLILQQKFQQLLANQQPTAGQARYSTSGSMEQLLRRQTPSIPRDSANIASSVSSTLNSGKDNDDDDDYNDDETNNKDDYDDPELTLLDSDYDSDAANGSDEGGVFLDADTYARSHDLIGPDGSLLLSSFNDQTNSRSSSLSRAFQRDDWNRKRVMNNFLESFSSAGSTLGAPYSKNVNDRKDDYDASISDLMEAVRKRQEQYDALAIGGGNGTAATNNNNTLAAAEELHKQVLAAEEGFTKQSTLFRESLIDTTKALEAAEYRRGEVFRQRQKASIDELEKNLADFEATFLSQLKNQEQHAQHPCESCGCELTQEEIEHAKQLPPSSPVICRVCWSEQIAEEAKMAERAPAPPPPASSSSSSSLWKSRRGSAFTPSFRSPRQKMTEKSQFPKSSSSSPSKNESTAWNDEDDDITNHDDDDKTENPDVHRTNAPATPRGQENNNPSRPRTTVSQQLRRVPPPLRTTTTTTFRKPSNSTTAMTNQRALFSKRRPPTSQRQTTTRSAATNNATKNALPSSFRRPVAPINNQNEWVKMEDPDTKETFYWNTKTDEMKWEKENG